MRSLSAMVMPSFAGRRFSSSPCLRRPILRVVIGMLTRAQIAVLPPDALFIVVRRNGQARQRIEERRPAFEMALHGGRGTRGIVERADGELEIARGLLHRQRRAARGTKQPLPQVRALEAG